MRVVVSPAARRDRIEAEAWYRARSPQAAARFREELRAAFVFIAEYPLGARVMQGQTRGKTLVRFPYTVMYVIVGDRVRVLAIADERRDPEHYAPRFL